MKAAKVLDQVLHFAYGTGAFAPVYLLQDWRGLLISATIVFAVREFVDQWPVNRWDDTALDLTVCFAGVGALIVAGLVLA